MITDTETAKLYASLPRNRQNKAFYQAARIQGVLERMLDSEDLKPTEASSLTRAWVELHGVKRIELGLGAPKTVPASNDPTLEPKRKRKPAAAQGEALTPDAPA